MAVSTLCAALLAGCAPPGYYGSRAYAQYQQGYHVVRTGETLYSIAWRYRLNYHWLAAWNRIPPPYLIHPGQRLWLRAPQMAPRHREVVRAPARPVRGPEPVFTARPLAWRWPTAGLVVQAFAAQDPTGRGLEITGKLGQPVVAAAPGRVVYSGSGLRGYGQLIIIKHGNSYLSAYGYNRKLLVKEGDRVQAGQPIAEMGSVGGKPPMLYFEIRRDGKPVDPLRYLPRR
ncbi:MAG TPA: peptidoglycan DD-metalloendopeptidase family protein [Gammaproteobacteria bacterium]|nr:peptidoglycan DD-metalloendopeptidase family protein [Gammaproteobacteria bacterium]